MSEPLGYVKCHAQDVREMCDTAVKLIQFQRRRYRRKMIRKCWNDAKVAYFKWSGFLSCWLIKPPTRRTAMKLYHAGWISSADMVSIYLVELEAQYAILGAIASNLRQEEMRVSLSMIAAYQQLLVTAQPKT